MITKDNAHLFLPLVQALAEGKTIQHVVNKANWVDMEDGVKFDNIPSCYRIKPEPVVMEAWLVFYVDGKYERVELFRGEGNAEGFAKSLNCPCAIKYVRHCFIPE